MKKKELLIVAFVFGKEYQGYIPFFFFSLYKHYPQYDVIVYVDRKINNNTQRLVELIPEYGKKYKITMIEKIRNKLSSQQMKAYRWLIYDKVFEQYQYLYIGDIDIYVCKESISLCEQHIKHMNLQKLLYSNIVRDYDTPPKWICKYQDTLRKIRLYNFIVKIYYKFFYHKRLSGLHFVNTESYYKAIKKQREKFFKVYYKTDLLSRLTSINMKLYSNEALLYYIVKKSHLKLPNQAGNDEIVLMCDEMGSYNFRPHHGLHFGIWRNAKKADEVFDEYMNTKLCQDFYTKFKEEMEYDAILKEIVEKSPVKVKKVINTMICDFENRMSK